MADPLIPRRDLDFLLFEWLSVGQRMIRDEVVDDRDTVNAVLDLAEETAINLFLSHYRKADKEAPRLVEGNVHILSVTREALREYADLGFFGTSFPEAVGGMGLSRLTASAVFAIFASANVSTVVYAMLTVANARLILASGNDAQIDVFARPQISGSWFGTMCLSEPQAGSSLGDVATRAVTDGTDGLGSRYRLSGNKAWISAGDHDASENIIHLVLAKVVDKDGALSLGSKGTSLFLVPKVLPSGHLNDIVVVGLNHKMGFRGTSNCMLNFGEQGNALGWLIGREGQGLALMFQMMNEARIGTGLAAAALGVRAYRHSLGYARDRTQGRSPQTRGGPQVPLTTHADVRRMLLQQKAYAEGALALCLYCAALIDSEVANPADGDTVALLGILTPVAKAWSSEFALAACDIAIQVHGGYGYTSDFDVEQLYRDNRLNGIHEGTTGIQAIDLLGRKILLADEAALSVLGRRVEATASLARTDPALASSAASLMLAWNKVDSTVLTLRTQRIERAFDDATLFLRAFGHVIVSWLWLDQVVKCNGTTQLHDGKRTACAYMFAYELPQAVLWLDSNSKWLRRGVGFALA